MGQREVQIQADGARAEPAQWKSRLIPLLAWARANLVQVEGHCQSEARACRRYYTVVLFCLDSEYAANAHQGTSHVHKNAVLIEKGRQLHLEEALTPPGRWVQVLP